VKLSLIVNAVKAETEEELLRKGAEHAVITMG
jgi:hypothetical protein